MVGLPSEASAAAAAQSMPVTFNIADAFDGSDELDSCTMSRKYVINSPRS